MYSGKKKFVLLPLLALPLLAAPAAYAHLTGAFADYLVTVADKETAARLSEDIEKTKRQIAELTPQVENKRGAFERQRETAADRLLLMGSGGVDGWLGLAGSSGNLTELLAAGWLAERSVDTLLAELDRLYRSYLDLRGAERTLSGYSELLQQIGGALKARDNYLADNPGLPVEQIANYLDIDWTSEVEDRLVAQLERDREEVARHAGSWAERAEEEESFAMSEDWLNTRSGLRYLIRSDHVYAVSDKADLHVLLIGQVLEEEDGTGASLHFEAGYFNGFLLPEALMPELRGFYIPYSSLKERQGLEGAETILVRQAEKRLIVEGG